MNALTRRSAYTAYETMNRITPSRIAIFSSDVMMKNESMVSSVLPVRRRFAFSARRAHARVGFVNLFVNCAAPLLNFDCFLDCLLVLWMCRRQLFNFQDVHAKIANLTQAQPGELRDCF